MAKEKTIKKTVDVKNKTIKPKPDILVKVQFIKTFFDGKNKEFISGQIVELPADYAKFVIDNKKAKVL